ncbi:hypothetical protein [Paenibacillus bovis]|uniref:Uncharacterized protein n=1 Tax=Paenibacillus bovis TaxID=1616788 RepID=A0A172ZF27_9BACL|nr:hypothetical protein [Paenibacillus bovis]ANF95982.1 hypothetical protein AR543_08165 [Paenibacillus bovis]
MASNTPNLNLLKKDPAVDGNDTFNIKTMLNDNWDKIDSAMGDIPDQVADLAKTAVTYKEWPAGVNSINGLVDIGVYYVPDLSKYTNIPNHPAGGTNAAWAGANAIINVYNVQPPYVGPAALRVVELYITLGTAQYFYRRNTKLSTSGSQTTITHGSWERVITTATGRLQLDDVSGSIPLAIGAGSVRTRWGFHVDAGGSMHIAPSTATGGTDSFNFDKGIAINSTTGMVTVETSLRVNNGRLNVYNNRNSAAQYEPSGEWAGRIINFADASNEHGLVVGNRWGANESTVFLAGASGIGSSFKEFFRISGIGKIYMRDTSDQTIDLAATLADLKQSGVNFKNSLVAQLNAKNISVATSEEMSTLINRISEIKARTVSGQVPRTNDAMGTGQDGSPMYQFESTLTTKDFSFNLSGINFFPEYLAVRLNEINGFYRNQPSSSIPLTNGVVRSDAAHVPVKDITFQILSRGNGSFVLRVTNTSSTYSTLRFTVASFSAVGI